MPLRAINFQRDEVNVFFCFFLAIKSLVPAPLAFEKSSDPFSLSSSYKH